MNKRMSKLEIEDLGLLPYKRAWEYQQKIVAQKLNDPLYPDKLILVQHPPVYTLGTGSTTDNLKFDLKSFSGEIYRIERGGEVTYHYPGQLVVYPLLNLRHYRQDLHWYLRQLEEVVIQLLIKYGINAERIEGLTGVWVNHEKIAAIGIKVKRWITMHGLALNVSGDMSGFKYIIPCGIKDKGVTQLSHFLPDILLENVKKDLITTFMDVFSR